MTSALSTKPRSGAYLNWPNSLWVPVVVSLRDPPRVREVSEAGTAGDLRTYAVMRYNDAQVLGGKNQGENSSENSSRSRFDR